MRALTAAWLHRRATVLLSASTLVVVAFIVLLALTPAPAFANMPLSFISGIPDSWTASDVTFTMWAIDDQGGLELWYRLNGGDLMSYTAPVTISAEGITSVEHWCNDEHALREEHHESFSRIDKSAPVSTITSLPMTWVPPGSYSFRLSAADAYSGVASTYYRINSGSTVAYVGGSIPVTASDTTWIDYWSVDAVGNIEGAKTALLRIDNGAPLTTISALPGGWSPAPVTFALAAQSPHAAVAGTFYRLGAGAPQSYGTSVTIAAEGTTPIAYWSTDASGGVETTRTKQVRVDLTAPHSAVSGIPAQLSQAPVTFSLTASDAVSAIATIRYVTDTGVEAGAIKDFRGATVISAEGTTTLTWWAVDLAGNQESPHTATIRIDTGPTTTFSGLGVGWAPGAVTVTLSGHGSQLPLSTYYQASGGTSALYTAPFVVSAEGATDVTYHSVDALGLIEPAKTLTVRIDHTPPTTALVGGAGVAGSSLVTFRLDSADNLSGVAGTFYALGTETSRSYLSPVTVAVAAGTAIRWWSVDGAGNVEVPHTSVLGLVPVQPVTTANVAPASWTRSNVTVTLSASSPNPLSGTFYRIGSGDFIRYTAPLSISVEGSTDIEFYSADVQDRVEEHRHATVRIDRTAPASTVTGIPAAATLGPVTVTLSATDALSGVAAIRYRVDGGAEALYTAPVVLPASASRITYHAVDQAGNAEAPHEAMVPRPRPSLTTTLSRPIATPSSPSHGGIIVLSGTVAPVSATRGTLDLVLYRKVSGAFRYWRTVRASVAAGSTRYSVGAAMPLAGSFAVRAHRDGAWSSYRYLTVR